MLRQMCGNGNSKNSSCGSAPPAFPVSSPGGGCRQRSLSTASRARSPTVHSRTGSRTGFVAPGSARKTPMTSAVSSQDADMLMLEPAEVASLLRNLDAQWHRSSSPPPAGASAGARSRRAEVRLRVGPLRGPRQAAVETRSRRGDARAAPDAEESQGHPLAPYRGDDELHRADVDPGDWAFRSLAGSCCPRVRSGKEGVRPPRRHLLTR
jgi:hypothetical protein